MLRSKFAAAGGRSADDRALALTMRIRLATMADVPALDTLIERSVRGLGGQFYSAAQIEGALGHALGLDRQLIADETYFCVEADEAGQLVACGGWSRRRTLFGSDHYSAGHGSGRDAGEMDPAVDAAKIRAIFVDPAWARRGLGAMMLRHCEEAAMSAGFRRFEMGSTLGGVAMYLLEGYAEEGRVQVPLPNGEALEVVRMSKRAGSR